MPTHTEQIVTLLRSIDTSLKRLLAQSKTGADAPVAPSSELDSKYGDPEVRFIPRDWSGANYKGAHYSECAPEFLDLLAAAHEWTAQRAEEKDELTASGKPVAPFKRRDAARARGWAKRKREGWQPPDMLADDALLADVADPEIDPFGGDLPPDSDIPFAWMLPFLLPLTVAASMVRSWT